MPSRAGQRSSATTRAAPLQSRRKCARRSASRTVRKSCSAACDGTNAAKRGGHSAAPRHRTVPLSARSMPATMRSSVLFPAPAAEPGGIRLVDVGEGDNGVGHGRTPRGTRRVWHVAA